MTSSHFFRYILAQCDEIQYRKLVTGYNTFIANADKSKAPSVKVFSPMSNEVLAELELIRDVSKKLQEKKDAEMARQAKMLEDGESEDEETEKEAVSPNN